MYGFDAPLEGLEPSHPASEAGALSPELQGQTVYLALSLNRNPNAKLFSIAILFFIWQICLPINLTG